jgi:hypothetical protein
VTDDDRNPDTATAAAGGHDSIPHDEIPQYEITVKGRLAPRWSAWFDGLAVTAAEDGTTVIAGPVADQSALHGLLQKLRDVGLPLLSLTEVSPDAPTTNPERQ